MGVMIMVMMRRGEETAVRTGWGTEVGGTPLLWMYRLCPRVGVNSCVACVWVEHKKRLMGTSFLSSAASGLLLLLLPVMPLGQLRERLSLW